MDFGLDKCGKATFFGLRLTSTSEIKLNEDTHIRELDQEDTYKYPGIDKGDGTQHPKMKEKIRKECCRGVRAILYTDFNVRDKLEAIKTLAISLVTYRFNVMN